MERIDRAVYEMVMRQGLRTKAAGTVQVHGMKKPGAADESARRQVAADGRGVAAKEEFGGVGMSLKRGRVSARPSLKLIIGGKK